jgi:hypothetical protein
MFFSLGNKHVPQGERTLLPNELGSFPKENSLLFEEVVFFTVELAWD